MKSNCIPQGKPCSPSSTILKPILRSLICLSWGRSAIELGHSFTCFALLSPNTSILINSGCGSSGSIEGPPVSNVYWAFMNSSSVFCYSAKNLFRFSLTLHGAFDTLSSLFFQLRVSSVKMASKSFKWSVSIKGQHVRYTFLEDIKTPSRFLNECIFSSIFYLKLLTRVEMAIISVISSIFKAFILLYFYCDFWIARLGRF